MIIFTKIYNLIVLLNGRIGEVPLLASSRGLHHPARRGCLFAFGSTSISGCAEFLRPKKRKPH